ncbi:TIR domain-containing protein [Streptomyces globosus]|uniref:TIR domain-containing protein n=1 Tax=Streptomyces globosus TaxID=68209 RepID=UPI0031DB3638
MPYERKRIFVSHAGPDLPWAEWIAWVLEQEGHEVDLDLWDWRMGERFEERVGAGLGERPGYDLVVMLLSPEYLDSPYAGREWEHALRAPAIRLLSPGRLLPVQIKPLTGPVPQALAPLPRLVLHGLHRESDVIARLSDAVRNAGAAAAADDRPGPAAAPERDADRPGRPGRPDRSAPAIGAVADAPRLPGGADRPALWNIPAGHPGVQGREALIQQIRLQLLASSAAAVPALHGLDGVGAHEVAQEYAQRFRGQYDLVWWIGAADRASVRAGYADLAGRLGITAAPGSPLRPDRDRLLDALFAHLATRPRWLVVLADAGPPESLAGLLPPEPGHLLLLPAAGDWTDPAAARRSAPPGRPEQPGDAGTGHRPAQSPTGPAGPPSRPRPRVLAVATEWSSSRGGLSTFNRRMCRALSEAGADVYCLVPAFDKEEAAAAAAAGVTLVEAERPPLWTGERSLLRKPGPALPGPPDLVVGHGRVTGPAAQLLAEDHYPQARRIHVIHMVPDQIEWLKEDRTDDPARRADDRSTTERLLGATAHRPVVLGPLLYSKYAKHFTVPTGGTRLLRVDPGFEPSSPEPRAVPEGDPEVLVFGRAEDVLIKGLDVAAEAMGRLVRRAHRFRGVDLAVRGVPEGEDGGALRERLMAYAGGGDLNIVPKPFRTDPETLRADLHHASLVLLPSRREGFGLSAVEAIAAGTPVLVSDASGLGLLLRETLGVAEAERYVVETRGDDQDAERWSHAVEFLLRDRSAAFARAAELREHLAARFSWSRAAAALLAELA